MSENTEAGMNRRKFLQIAGVTGAGTAALSGCSTSKVEKLIPYLVQSEDQVPGIPTVYASTCTECAAGCGLHVKTREARAIKLEGNPDHPVNRGTLCARGHAALQGLYNPGRLKGPMARDASGGFTDISWDEALTRLAEKLGSATAPLAVLSGAGDGTGGVTVPAPPPRSSPPRTMRPMLAPSGNTQNDVAAKPGPPSPGLSGGLPAGRGLAPMAGSP